MLPEALKHDLRYQNLLPGAVATPVVPVQREKRAGKSTFPALFVRQVGRLPRKQSLFVPKVGSWKQIAGSMLLFCFRRNRKIGTRVIVHNGGQKHEQKAQILYA